MYLAKRVRALNPSSTLQITALAKKLSQQGQDIVSFGAGEPDFDTPDFIKESAISAIRSGFTKYTPSTGIIELKKAICEKFKKDNKLGYAAEQVAVSSGAKHCIFNIILTVVEEGDEVIIPAPYWVSYPEMVTVAQGVSKFVYTKPANGFKITPEELEESITAKTKLFILNSPSNPTGAVYEKKELQVLADICVKHNIYVISDEIYEKLIYGAFSHFSIGSLNEKIYNLTFTVNGVSKAYAMTGWRIGYFAGPLEAVKAIKNLQDHSTSNPCSIAQKAALCALTIENDWTEKLRIEFQKRKDYLCGRIDKIPALKYIKPNGAFYLFCDISKTGLNSSDFAFALLKEANVAVIPGAGFGCDDYIRFSFAMKTETIGKGIDRLEKWLGSRCNKN